MDPADLERRIDVALKRLPVPAAPPSLVPRVMAAVETVQRAPWYRREWVRWPRAWQAASALAAASLVALLVWWVPSLEAPSWLSAPSGQDVAAVTTRVEPTLVAMQILWRVVFEPFVPWFFALAMLMCVAVVVIGITLNYLAFGRTWQR